MAVKIRLSRIGTTNRPFYRLVAVDSRKKRDGAIIENIGTYDGLNAKIVLFNEPSYLNWISKGAQPTDSAKKVYRLYKKTTTPVEESVAKPKRASKKPVKASEQEQTTQVAAESKE